MPCWGGDCRIDIGRFHELLAQVAAHSHPPHRLCDACLAALTEAASLYTADFMAGFSLQDAVEFDAWQAFQADARCKMISPRPSRSSLSGWLGRSARSTTPLPAAHARRWLALDPLNEAAHRLLMQLHARERQPRRRHAPV